MIIRLLPNNELILGFDQWVQKIQDFLKIPKSKVGQIGDHKFSTGELVTVALIQTLARMKDLSKLSDALVLSSLTSATIYLPNRSGRPSFN